MSQELLTEESTENSELAELNALLEEAAGITDPLEKGAHMDAIQGMVEEGLFSPEDVEAAKAAQKERQEVTARIKKEGQAIVRSTVEVRFDPNTGLQVLDSEEDDVLHSPRKSH